jgi:hypothetical protein
VTDPRKFKAPFIPKGRIWQEADRLRVAHPAGQSMPVRILDLPWGFACLRSGRVCPNSFNDAGTIP